MLRLSVPSDLPTIYSICRDLEDTHLADHQQMPYDDLDALVCDGEMFVVELDHYPVGVFWFTEGDTPYYRQIHFLVRPQYLRRVIKDNTIANAIGLAFKTYKIRKILATPYSFQTGAIKLLELHRFQKCGKLKKQAQYKKVNVDQYVYELHKPFFKQFVAKQDTAKCLVSLKRKQKPLKKEDKVTKTSSQQEDMTQPAVKQDTPPILEGKSKASLGKDMKVLETFLADSLPHSA